MSGSNPCWLLLFKIQVMDDWLVIPYESKLKRRFIGDKDSKLCALFSNYWHHACQLHVVWHIYQSRFSRLLFWDMGTSSTDFLSPFMTYIRLFDGWFSLTANSILKTLQGKNPFLSLLFIVFLTETMDGSTETTSLADKSTSMIMLNMKPSQDLIIDLESSRYNEALCPCLSA